MSSSVHIDNKKRPKGPANGLHDTTLTEEKECSKNFTKQQKKFCFSCHHNVVNS